MGMRMGVYHDHKHSLVCCYCGGSVCNHADDCPQGRVEAAQDLFLGAHCPKCNEYSVEINDDDFYECRNCHTQYTTGLYDSSWEQKWLWCRGEMIKVLVHPNQGSGVFPVDENFRQAREAFELVRRQRKRRR